MYVYILAVFDVAVRRLLASSEVDLDMAHAGYRSMSQQGCIQCRPPLLTSLSYIVGLNWEGCIQSSEVRGSRQDSVPSKRADASSATD